ncbi:MAG: sigma-70 family RNA polymerase sigma factor [Paludibacteraceae bacterium]|nr:sigma-70 family RNA polymerase sigma factor [Paludibacteraceae bacterium]
MTIDNQFIKEHAYIVRTIARQYGKVNNQREDLLQEGYIGLIEAAKRYDPTTGVQFASYASWWVRKYIREYMLNNSQIVRLPAKTKDYYKPLTEDIETPLYEEEGDVIRYADILTDGTTAETDLIRQEEHQRLMDMIEKLSPREQQIIQQIYGIDCEAVPMKEVAKRMGLSYDRVKKIHAKCLRKLSKGC